jgi:poly(3-hydroxybutyrate) depolymerase
MASAYALLQSEAETYGLDPQRMHVGGHSAGGHLAHTFNLRWAEFAQACSHPSGCPAALGAIGFEGIYDISAWDAYDAAVWNGNYACATRKAFGAPGPSPAACIDPQLGDTCWNAGSPSFLAQNAQALGIAPVADAAGRRLGRYCRGNESRRRAERGLP